MEATMTKVGEDINNLISQARDYVSDAVTQLDSARDKIAFLDWPGEPQARKELEELIYTTDSLFKQLRAQKQRFNRLLNSVQP